MNKKYRLPHLPGIKLDEEDIPFIMTCLAIVAIILIVVFIII